MNIYEVESYNNVSIDQLLDRQLKSPTQNTWVFVLAKAKTEQCTQDSIKMTLMLLQRDGDKWLQVLKRFSHLEFKLVFSFCIKRMKTYKALIESVNKLGESQHQRMLQENIQKTIDGQRNDSSINSHQLWTLYLEYLSQWVRNLAHRTLYSLQRIQKRLGSVENIYESLVDRQKIPFVKILCEIVKLHEQKYMRRLQLRRFWQSIPNIIIFLQQTLYKKNMIYRVANSLDSYDNKPQGMMINMREHNQQQQLIQRDRQMMVMLLIKSCKVTILQDIFIRSTRLATVLLKVQIINYNKYSNTEQLQRLQSSLIYHIRSDDLPSLISQLLVALSQNIPNFITLFVSQCMFYLEKDNLDQIVTSDIILKLCILSKMIIQHTQCNGWEFSIKDLIDRLVVLSDSRSEIMQIKTLLMMHYFKQILPQSYFIQYHSIIFRMLKSIVKQSIQNNQINEQSQFLMNDQYHNKNIFNNTYNNTNNNNQSNLPFYIKPFKYTSISYTQCIKILQQQTQRKQQHQQIQMKIRRKKFNNNKYVNDLFRNHVLQISDKLIDLVSIEGYCEEQTKILQIVRNLLAKYPIVAERNTQYLIKILARQFMAEYYRLRQVSNKNDRNFSKMLLFIQCLQLVWGQVTQQTYFHCQQHMVPIMQLLRQQYQIDFQDDIVKTVGIMIVKANSITAQLNNFIIYSKGILRNSQGSLLPIQSIIKQMCRNDVVRSVRQQWGGLVMYMSNIFAQYLSHTITNETIEVYHKYWVQSTHLIQLFIQTYSQQYQLNQQLASTLYNIQSILLASYSINEQTNQLLMTIYHVVHTTKVKTMALSSFNNDNFSNKGQQLLINDYERLLKYVTDLNLYQQKYSLHLVQLIILDTLNVNLRKGIFDFSSSDNPIYPFIESYKSLIINMQDLLPTKINTPNDILPFNKINLIQYTNVILDSLRKDKVIDIQQFTQLKSIFLPQNYLISFRLFQ